MGKSTGIAWTRSSWNPWIGCTEISPGCDHCYARELDAYRKWGGATHWGAGVPRHRTKSWDIPRKWDRLCSQERATGKVVVQERDAWSLPGFWPVFPSLCDPFDNEVPDEWRRDLWDLIEQTPNLTWLLLTKRIGNVMRMLRTVDWAASKRWNVWLGASIVNQDEATRDVLKLLAIPARRRFISYEPALGPVDWCEALGIWWNQTTGQWVKDGPSVDQIIFGGESNQGKHKARDCNLDWARNTLKLCRAAGTAFFMKQTGSDHTALYERTQKDRAGADPAEWPEDLRVQEFPA